MNCRAFRELLQRRLDGAESDPGALDGHRKDCAEWAGLVAAAARLAAGLRRLAPPAPPADLTARIVGRVLQDRRARRHRRRRWASAGTLAVAASLLLAIGLRAWRPVGPAAPQQPAPPPVVSNQSTPAGPAAIRESVAEARSAVE